MKLCVGIAVAGVAVTAALLAGEGDEMADKRPSGPAPADDADKIPLVIPDESAQDWVVDRFAGNSTTGPLFYQGPAREVGGLGKAGVTELPDGRILVSCAAGLAEMSSNGVLRLFMGDDGLIEGPLEQCRSGGLIWNAKEKALYITGPRCLRKVVEKPDGTGWVEVFAGIPTEEPGKSGPRNGPVKNATFPLSHRGIVCNSQGVFYTLDVWHGIRKIENGEVSGVKLKFVDEPKRFDISLSGNLTLGEDDDTLYVADHWSWVARRVDLKTGEVRNLAFMPRGVKHDAMPEVRWDRCGQNADGPALTHASHNSGLGGVSYDRFHKALWFNGDDETRFRWIKNGWVKSVIGCDNKSRGSSSTGRWSIDSIGVPGPKASIAWCAVSGFDSKGGVYIGGGSLPHGVWRAYNKKEGTSHETWWKAEVNQ
ncbi:MAG: hypothetical protein C0404_10070 [Verrucomicrobia bacterium]|nr:hypothetical protein [Verrucomicrobiota bacterium]